MAQGLDAAAGETIDAAICPLRDGLARLVTRGAHRLLLVLSWLWLLAVIGYMAWSTFAFEGLYRWLAEWEMAQWGQYYRKWTAMLPILILGMPAFAYLGWRSRLRQAA